MSVVGRTIRDITVTDFGSTITLVLDDSTHYRLTAKGYEYDDGTIEVKVLDRVDRMAEIIDRRVAEFERKVADAARAVRAEEQRIVRERMERLLSPRAYREWLRRHQPSYILNQTLKRTWSAEALMSQLHGENPLLTIGEPAIIPLAAS